LRKKKKTTKQAQKIPKTLLKIAIIKVTSQNEENTIRQTSSLSHNFQIPSIGQFTNPP